MEWAEAVLLCDYVSESDYVAPLWSSWWGISAGVGTNETDNFHAQPAMLCGMKKDSRSW